MLCFRVLCFAKWTGYCFLDTQYPIRYTHSTHSYICIRKLAEFVFRITMELEHLNKTQVILLTLLVSFVTSIATGITTVTLMDQAPPGITNTISKVVERTIEKVITSPSQGAATVKTVVVYEESKIADAVDSQKNTIVRVGTVSTQSATGTPPQSGDQQIALGFVLSPDGLIVTDSAAVSNDTTYTIVRADGSALASKAVFQDENLGIALLKADLPKGEQFARTVSLADSNTVKLGQSVWALSGSDAFALLSGLITGIETESLPSLGDISTSTKKSTEEISLYRSVIKMNIAVPKLSSGTPLFNVNGEVIGMNIVRESGSFAVPVNLIKDSVNLLGKQQEKPKD